jgi:hypothetical protein
MQYLQSVSGDRVIIKEMWPHGSPDLNPCNSKLLGMLNDKSGCTYFSKIWKSAQNSGCKKGNMKQVPY